MTTLSRFLKDFPQADADNPRNVMVVVRSLDEQTLKRLGEMGLQIHEVIGDTIFGTSRGDLIPALQKDPAVRGVESAVQLQKHVR